MKKEISLRLLQLTLTGTSYARYTVQFHFPQQTSVDITMVKRRCTRLEV